MTSPDENDRDYVTIGETGPNGRKYLDYKYTSKGSPAKLAAPEKAGDYELRYILAKGDTIIARQAIKVGGVTATLTAPAQVAAGAKFKVTWTGPDNERDFITMVKAGTVERTYDRYVYTSKGSTLEFTAPDVAGAYEIRYATGKGYLTLGRASITVGAVTASLSAPATAVAGESFKVSWKGPDNARNFVTVVPKGAREGEYSSAYFYTTPQSNPGNLVAPLKPGAYEVRFPRPEMAHAGKADLTVTRQAGARQGGRDTGCGREDGAIESSSISGSMLQKLGSERRIDIAKRTLDKLVGVTIPAGTPFALRVFGREVDSCQTDLDVPVAPLNAAAVKQRIAALVAKNGAKTPIGASLEKAVDDLKSVSGEKLIVLVTDGEETLWWFPSAAMASLRRPV